MRTVAPSTASPFSIWGLMRKKRESFRAASPKPSPMGVSATTMQLRTVPLTATAQLIVALPAISRRTAPSG
jgi:hypothetical protein